MSWPAGEEGLVVDEERSLSWRAVYGAAAALREALGDLPEPRLCVATEDRFQLGAAVVAALGGDLHLVLPHGLQVAQIEAACREQGCAALLGPDDLELPGVDVRRIAPLSEDAAGDPPPSSGAPARVILHTGGSTGRPRAWERALQSLLDEAAAVGAHLGLHDGERILATVSPLHIYGFVLSLLLPMQRSGRVVRRSSYFPREVERGLGEHGCTLLVTTPPHLRVLRGVELAAPLRQALSSGSMLAERDAGRLKEKHGLPVSEVYGSTETGAVATRTRAHGETWWTPLPQVQVRIAEDRLWVGSPFLARDIEVNGQGYTRTGDRATATRGDDERTEGFRLQGRVDGIVKVAGVRVDVHGVEEQLRALAGVRDACVLTAPVDGPRENKLLAAVVYEGDAEVLDQALANSLAPVERPRSLLRLERIPTSPPGKHDREALRALFDGRSGDGSDQD